MGDTIDFFRAMKEHRRESRLDALIAAQQEWQEFVAAAEAGGYTLHVMSERHWNVYRNSRAVAQYWPSANKWQVVRGGKIKHGTRDEFRRTMAEGRL